MKKIFIALMGGMVLLIGLAMLVLPGPGLPILAAGLAILATEFIWAQRVMRKARGVAAKAERRYGLIVRLQRWRERIVRRSKPTSNQTPWKPNAARP